MTCPATRNGWDCTLPPNHIGDHAHIAHMPNGFPFTQAFWPESHPNVLHVIHCTLYDCERPIGHDGAHMNVNRDARKD